MPENESDSKEIKREDAIAQLRYLERLYSQQYEVINDEIATYTIGLSGLARLSSRYPDVRRIKEKVF